MKLLLLPYASATFLAAMCGMAMSQATLSVPSSSFTTIQSAINAAQPGDLIAIGPGIYFESLDLLGKSVTISGSGAASTTIDGTGSLDSVVKMVNGEGAGTVLEDVCIANGPSGWLSPQAATIPGALPTGGGLVVAGIPGSGGTTGTILVRRCHFTGNATTGGGGGAAVLAGSSVAFEDCQFTGNSGAVGGGIAIASSSATLNRCLIAGNIANQGGGLYASNYSTVSAIDTIIDSNLSTPAPPSTQSSGGGIFGSFLSLTLDRCVVRNNSALGISSLYGGVYLQTYLVPGNPSSLTVKNSLFHGNSSDTLPVFISGAGTIDNCTCTLNAATGASSIPVLFNVVNAATLAVSNCIITFNTGGPFSTSANTGTLTIANSNVAGGFPGVGNIDLDPLFIDAAGADFRLRYDSPLIDSGSNAAVGVGELDLDGHPRILNQLVDIGAYESNDIANHASAAGTLNDPASGTPFRALTASGDDGGLDYRATVPAFSPWSLSFTSPPWMTPHPDFAIFGALAEATIETVVNVPLGIGDMSFLPCPLLPQFEGPVFTLTSTVPLPCNEVLPSVPGPSWSTPIIPGLPAPLDVSFQGVVLDSNGGVYTTNLLIVNIR